MILIAESGSTKVDWIAINRDGNVIFSTQTLGLNASVLASDVLFRRIKKNDLIYSQKNDVEKIYFYGAGLGIESAVDRIEEVLSQIFENSSLSLHEDTHAAVYATVDKGKPAIVGILGTGSNCSFYDGKRIEQKVSSLGYIIMDEASGNFFGKQLIRSYYFNELSQEMATKLETKYDLNPNTIKDHLYRKENPNTYLAGVGKFVIQNKKYPLFRTFIFEGLHRFIEHQIFQFPNCYDVPVHFIGSVAYYLEQEIKIALDNYGLKLGRIVKRPIDRLVVYHQELLKQDSAI